MGRRIREACAEVADDLADVGVISLSVTTPGLTPMAADGTALGPAILFLDGRSHAQAAAIREVVGEDRFLAEACNLPVSGGSSLSSILWIRDEQPETWAAHRDVRSLQHVPHQAPDRRVGHRPLDDLDHRPVRHGSATT